VTTGTDLRARLALLRERFDGSFADPPPSAAGEYEDLLGIALGSEQYRVRLREVEGLYLDRAVTPVPSALPHLLGVSDFRGELVAVYDLAALLGYPRAERTRYLLRSARQSVAFAFERFLGHLRLTAAEPGVGHGHAQTIIDLTGLVERLEQQVAGVVAGEA
jgi:purine-binding chemotaxis protein CheW